MKSFREQFDGRIDMHSGSVVLYESEYDRIQGDAFSAGVKVGADKMLELIREASQIGDIAT